MMRHQIAFLEMEEWIGTEVQGNTGKVSGEVQWFAVNSESDGQPSRLFLN